MKLWSHICFLVLATSSCSGGQAGEGGSTFLRTTDGGRNDSDMHTSPSPSLENERASTSPKNTRSPSNEYTDPEEGEDGNSTVTETTLTTGVTSVSRWSSVAVVTTDVSTTTTSTLKPGSAIPTWEDVSSEDYSTGGYVLLVLIVVLIVALCVILYMLRRSSRTYSFDLQRPVPLNYANEPTGTFEPVHLDDLEPPAQLDDVATGDLSPPAVGNGTTAQSEETGSNGLKSPVEEQDANGVGTCPISSAVTEQSAENPLDSASLLSGGALEEPQNENNNHPFCSSDLFVDINITEPTWSD